MNSSAIGNTLYSLSTVCFLSDNSMLRYVNEEKVPEEYLTGRSAKRDTGKRAKKKSDKSSSPSHYGLLPALQMEVLRQESMSTPSSDSTSLYHVCALNQVLFSTWQLYRFGQEKCKV